MSDNKKRSPQERHYPERYEKLIPIALGVIVVAIVLILVIAAAIALQILPGASY